MKKLFTNLFKKKVTLTYTDEMKAQDALWNEEKEDIIVMESLQRQLLEEAKSKGLDIYTYHYYTSQNESCYQLFYNKNHYLWESNEGTSSIEEYGFCKPLKEYLEGLLNGTNHLLKYYDEEERNEILNFDPTTNY